MRKPMTTTSMLRTHLNNKHKSESNEYVENENMQFISQNNDLPFIRPQMHFSTREQNIYHHINRNGLGNHYLVGKSNFNTNLSDVYARIGNDQVRMQMAIADFVATLSRQQRNKFCNVIAAVEKSIVSNLKDAHIYDKITDWKYTCIPNCHKRARKLYIEGNDALLPNVPHPNPICLDENHAYMPIKEMIAHYLALDVPMHELWTDDEQVGCNNSYSNFYQSPSVTNIMENAKKLYCGERVLVLLGIEFSDDFDPNNSIKANRQSVWMKCLTISPPSHNLHGMTTTFPISFSQKDICHEVVEQKMCEELGELMIPGVKNIFYYKRTDSMVRVHFEFLMSLQDQPERRSCTAFLLGSGIYSARWGYSCNFNAIKNQLVPCDRCLNVLVSGSNHVDQTCTKCSNWDLISTTAKTMLHSNPPDDYPKDIDGVKLSTRLVPFQLTFELLDKAVKTAHSELVDCRWNKKNVHDYLNTFCINTNAVAGIVKHAENILTMNHLVKNKSNHLSDYKAIMTCKSMNPKFPIHH